MADWRERLPSRRTLFKVLSIAVVIVLASIAALSLYVYKQSVGKFEIRRLSLPTRIFADFTPLKMGTAISLDQVVEHLQRLGYRQQPNGVAESGDYAVGKTQVDIFTREFTHPSGAYAAQPARITFQGPAIAAVSALRGGAALDNIALEPELLTSILSDQLENRRPASLEQIPKHLQDAVIATEDIRFWHHPGVDPIGMFRAVFRNLRAGGVSEGASTLTQQLVKNYYLTSERTYKRKIVEAFMAVVLDAKYSKREILEAYLNDIYLGRNRSISIIGVGEASRFYFGKPVSEISVAEAATLAGMVRSPNNNSPFANPERSLTRRNTVLKLMLDQRKIDEATYRQALATPLPRKPTRERSGLGSIPFYVDRVLQEMAADYGIKDVKGRGLAIYTAIDLGAQDTATRTLESGLQSLEKGNKRLRDAKSPLQGVIINVDVPSGEIRALVGGRNYDLSQFNRALNSKRQVGSLFKPFIFLTAFEPSLSNQNVTPATLVSDSRFVLKRKFAADWSPHNYEDSYHGTVTVQEALEHSMNAATVRVGLASGIEAIIKTAHTLGVQTEIDGSNPSVLLGAVGIPPIEMADAYSTIARIGSRLPLRTIRFVTDDRGKVVSAGDAVQPVQVFPARDVYVLTTVMKGVVDRGTAASIRSLGFNLTAAGKTGTTNDARDAWFIGFTPKSLTLTWLGFDDNSVVGLSGGQAAVPIWTRYMQAVTAGQTDVDFQQPAGIALVQIDETSGGVAAPQCPRHAVVTDAFKEGTQPSNPCPLHSPQAPPLGVDQFGNPISLDTAVTTTSTSDTAVTAPPPIQNAPESTLTGGGIFRSDTGAPPVTNTSPPPVRIEPPPDRVEPPPPTERPRERERPPATETAPPPDQAPPSSQPTPSTNTSSPPG
ncbi:MAG: PBP1A family penicillin-binding protein [Acidobacteriota bacterium]